MVALTKALEEFTGSDEQALQVRERLEFVKSAAEAHLKLAETRIAASLHGQGGGISDLYIVPGSVQSFQQGYTISSGEEATAGINAAVDQFFSGEYKEGLKTILHSAVSVFFGDTTAGESVKDLYLVTMEHNAFIRVDVAFWKYYFTHKSVTDAMEQAFCYTFVKSVIDHNKVPIDAMIYNVSEHVGDDLDKVHDFLVGMRKLYAELEEADSAETAAHVARKSA